MVRYTVTFAQMGEALAASFPHPVRIEQKQSKLWRNDNSMSNNTSEVIRAKVSTGSRIFARPSTGAHQAVICDLIVKPDVKRKNPERGEYTQDEIVIVYQLADRITEEDLLDAANGRPLTEKDLERVGERFIVYDQQMNFKLSGSKATNQTKLTGRIAGILGARVPDEQVFAPEDEQFNFASLLGRNVELMITETPDKNDPTKIYSNVVGVSPWDARKLKRSPLIEVENYVRVKDRNKADQSAAAA